MNAIIWKASFDSYGQKYRQPLCIPNYELIQRLGCENRPIYRLSAAIFSNELKISYVT